MHRIPGCSFILTSRGLTPSDLRHIARFTERLRDRELMSALIHVGSCRNRSCIERNGEIQRQLLSNPEIPGTLIAQMEYWRTQVEGYPPRPKKSTDPEKGG